MIADEPDTQQQPNESGTPSYALPAILIGCAVLLEASAKPVAKALASGLQDRAYIEGTIAVFSLLGLIAGIGLLIRTYLARKKSAG